MTPDERKKQICGLLEFAQWRVTEALRAVKRGDEDAAFKCLDRARAHANRANDLLIGKA